MIRVFTKREKLILYATFTVIILSVAFNFLIEPVLNRNSRLNNKIILTEMKLNKYMKLIAQKEYIEEKFRKYSQAIVVPGSEGDKTVGILSELENLAKSSNINIVDIRPQRPEEGKLYSETAVELRTEGDMASYFQFIYKIDNSLLLLDIKELRLNAKLGTDALEGDFLISQISLD